MRRRASQDGERARIAATGNTKRVHHAVGGDVTVVAQLLPGGPLPVAKTFRGQGGRRKIFKSPNPERGGGRVVL